MKFQRDSEIINELCEYLQVTAYQLAIDLGYKNASSIYHVQKGISSISPQMARRITDKYPQISYLYLVGQGGTLVASADTVEAQLFLKEAELSVKETFKEQFTGLLIDVNEIRRKQDLIIQMLSKLG